MDTNVLPAFRHVDRIATKVDHGPTAQSDSSSIIIAPDNVRLIDPFLIMGEEWWRSPGFDWHPHRGIETITVVLDGVLEHGDSLGNSGLLEGGDVQWMTAGRGVIHRELAFRNERVHVMLPASYRAFAHVISGRLTVAGRPARAGQTAWSDPVATDQAAASVVELATPDGGEQTKVMLFAGQPLGETVVLGGPFVMNSRGRDRAGVPRLPHRQLRTDPAAGTHPQPLTAASVLHDLPPYFRSVSSRVVVRTPTAP